MEWKKIAEGVYNTIVVKQEVEKIAEERIAICRKCSFDSKVVGRKGYERCLKCKCNLNWKTHSLSASCPIDKWQAVEGISHDESNKIDEITGNDD